MNRKLIMGTTFEEAMLKNLEEQDLSYREKLNWIDNIPIFPNPLSLRTGDLELRLFKYKLAESIKMIRKTTQTELQSYNFIKRLYQQTDIEKIQDIFAIEFTQEDMENFYAKINHINHINPINPINPNILNNKRVWRIVLFENIEDYELRKSMEELLIPNETTEFIAKLKNLSIY